MIVQVKPGLRDYIVYRVVQKLKTGRVPFFDLPD